MPLVVFNTLSGMKEEFKPLRDNEVRIYVCGPTVYDYSHIGHARTYIVFDVIVRYLRYKGYKVKYIVNITDIEDKIIRRAKELGITPLELARKFEKEFFKDIERLGLVKADRYPRATEHIRDMIKVIEALMRKGYAYRVGNDVYFDVSKLKDYGKLSRQKVNSLKAGARVEIRRGKKSPLDFALWRGVSKDEPGWDSPWGKGRPGWHIECTVMAIKHLGEQIDLHGGGEDLIFPHHENEIAQSEAYSGKKPFAKYWLHTGLLMVKGEKMSKSLRNIISIREFIDKYGADTLRLLVLSSHYRSPIEFSEDKALQAKRSLIKLYGILERARLMVKFKEKGGKIEEVRERAKEFRREFEEAMNDDFNTPKALAALFRFSSYLESLIDKGYSGESIRVAYETVVWALKLLGFKMKYAKLSEERLASLLPLLIEIRGELRRRRVWDLADRIRDKLGEMGIALEDREDGTVWRYIPNLLTD
ncbi:MAG: cysteine--tRNA ligase [Thermofilum sp. ex4484_15]|nr:MAG: cysteine--tRNA ligase [Thermofilum sp. ex4484_15]